MDASFACVALPWSAWDRPSAALGTLKAFAQQHGFAVDCHYEYLRIASTLGYRFYNNFAENAYDLGELLYIPLLYPERKAVCKERIVAALWERVRRASELGRENPDTVHPDSLAAACEKLFTVLDKHLADLVDRTCGLRGVGLTTSFGQLFANLAYAKRLKAASPDTHVVFGGTTVSDRVGTSIIGNYDYVDAVVQGEGELPWLGILNHLTAGEPEALSRLPGVLTRKNMDKIQIAKLSEVKTMDSLPTPNYDEYAEMAAELELSWTLPVEGSRGCWWDRVKKTGNARSTCYFCNLNVQWSGYREKSVDRVVTEVDELSARYSRTELFFLDNIIRARGVDELSRGLESHGRDYEIFYEMRANISPLELVSLKRAGLDSVQFGIEGLSTSYLKRLGKGTRAIDNLQAIKLACELGVRHYGNLITDFPGSTEAEVEENWRNLTRYAVCYEPLSVVPFMLGVGSTVDRLRDEFPIENIRNSDTYAECLPEDVTLELLDLSFDHLPGAPNWDKIGAFAKRWIRAHDERMRPLLTYRNGREFLTIYDERGSLAAAFEGLEEELPMIANRPARAMVTLRGHVAELYLFLTAIRKWKDIVTAFAGRLSEEVITEHIDSWCQQGIVFREDDRVLSLAAATTPEIAMRRIESMESPRTVRKARPATKRSTLVRLRSRKALADAS